MLPNAEKMQESKQRCVYDSGTLQCKIADSLPRCASIFSGGARHLRGLHSGSYIGAPVRRALLRHAVALMLAAFVALGARPVHAQERSSWDDVVGLTERLIGDDGVFLAKNRQRLLLLQL